MSHKGKSDRADLFSPERPSRNELCLIIDVTLTVAIVWQLHCMYKDFDVVHNDMCALYFSNS